MPLFVITCNGDRLVVFSMLRLW